MYKTLQQTFKRDHDLPQRAFDLAMRQRVIKDQLYDNLRYSFYEEHRNGEYIPLKLRRPSATFNLCRSVVHDASSLLFSEAHFPPPTHPDKATREALAAFSKDAGLNALFMDAAIRGSVGSVALYVRVLDNRVFIDVKDTTYLTPVYKSRAPDTLQSITEQYKVKGAALKACGYTGQYDDQGDYWLRTVWDERSETAYLPREVNADDDEPWVMDSNPERTLDHNLGFCPWYWVKNLPGGEGVDGAPTFRDDAINLQIECDYLLSQNGRSLRYGMDPQLVLKEPAFNQGANQPIVGEANSNSKPAGAGQPIVIDKEGDAKLLETNGAASAAVVEFLKTIRELALESLGGNRASAEKLATAQSGKAMELLQQPLVWLADKMRVAYGEGALLWVFKTYIRLSQMFKLVDKEGELVGKLVKGNVTLTWPAWFSPTATDMQQKVETLARAVEAGLITIETAVRKLAGDFDIEDIDAEVALATAQLKLRQEAHVKAAAPLPRPQE